MTLLDRVRAALGEPLLRDIGATGMRAYEAGTGVYFDFRGAPCGADHFVILVSEEAVCRVQLVRRKNLSLVQGKSGVPLARLAPVVRRLSRHGS